VPTLGASRVRALRRRVHLVFRTRGGRAMRGRGAQGGAHRWTPLPRRPRTPLYQGVPPRAVSDGGLLRCRSLLIDLGRWRRVHLPEDLGLEASVQFTRFRTAVTDTYERRYPQIQIEDRTNKPGRLYFGHLVWSFAYGKLRWFGGGISRFDFNFALGAGVTDDSTARGLTGSAGIGTKWYFGRWFSVRSDSPNHILRETLIGEEPLVNDLVVTGGISIWFPFGG